jgi:hypothetical protein
MTGVNAYEISVYLITIMIAVSGIILGLGYAIDDKKLKDFGRTELLQSLINSAIVGLLFVAFSSTGFFTLLINTIANAQYYAASCPAYMSSNYAICFAYNYLIGVSPVGINGSSHLSLMDTSLPLLAALSVSYTTLSLVSSIQLSVGFISVGLTSVLTPLLTQMNYLINAITLAIMGIEAQAVLLEFIAITAVPVLLPVGIVLRSLYFTRKLGGAIIAIAIGLFGVFPLTYLLNAELTNNYFSTASNYTAASLISSLNNMKSSIVGSVSSLSGARNSTTSNGLLSSITGILGGLAGSAEALFEEIANLVALLVIEIFFLPAFSLILTAISIKEFARILGSEVSFGRLYMY